MGHRQTSLQKQLQQGVRWVRTCICAVTSVASCAHAAAAGVRAVVCDLDSASPCAHKCGLVFSCIVWPLPPCRCPVSLPRVAAPCRCPRSDGAQRQTQVADAYEVVGADARACAIQLFDFTGWERFNDTELEIMEE